PIPTRQYARAGAGSSASSARRVGTATRLRFITVLLSQDSRWPRVRPDDRAGSDKPHFGSSTATEAQLYPPRRCKGVPRVVLIGLSFLRCGGPTFDSVHADRQGRAVSPGRCPGLDNATLSG